MFGYLAIARGTTWKWAALIFAIAAVHASAQQPEASSAARQLFLTNVNRKDALPPVRPASTPGPGMGAVHLGLRYNLVLIRNGKPEPIDSDRILHGADCFAIQFQSNRSGYLYVLAKQSSGAWMPLLPSPEMPDEANVIDPGKSVQIPRSYCFEIHDPPGTETLFVALSRDPRDLYELYEGIKGKTDAPARKTPAPVSTQVADARMVNDAVVQLSERFGSRDIAIRRVDQPLSGDEPKGSVYVVNSSNMPASTVVTQINVVHR